MLDVMSGGRFVLGIAIGYKPDEFALYGAELEKRGARFEEQLAIMQGLWTQESRPLQGAYYTVEGRLEPKPVTQPHPPVWIGGWGDITLRRAATLADNWIPGPTADLRAAARAASSSSWTDRAAAGRTAPVTEWPLTRDVIIADTDRRGARAGRRSTSWCSYRREYAGGWRHPFIDASIATDLDTADEGPLPHRRARAGHPRARARSSSEYGVTHLICRLFFPGMPHRHIMRELDLCWRRRSCPPSGDQPPPDRSRERRSEAGAVRYRNGMALAYKLVSLAGLERGSPAQAPSLAPAEYRRCRPGCSTSALESPVGIAAGPLPNSRWIRRILGSGTGCSPTGTVGRGPRRAGATEPDFVPFRRPRHGRGGIPAPRRRRRCDLGSVLRAAVSGPRGVARRRQAECATGWAPSRC